MTAPKLSTSTPFGRFYAHPKRQTQVPSITNVKDVKNIPGLKHWAARGAAEYAADNLAKLAPLDRNERVQLIRQAPFTARPDGPSAVGDLVHEWIDRVIKGGSVTADEVEAAPPTARGMILQFRAFALKYKPDWVMSEFTVWSEKYQYAGTADWAAHIHGWLVLGDTKTGAKVYPDTRYQLAALANADFILDEDGTERELPHFERFAILHIRPTFAKLIPVVNIPAAFQAFLGLKAVFDDDMAHRDSSLMVAPKIEASRMPTAA